MSSPAPSVVSISPTLWTLAGLRVLDLRRLPRLVYINDLVGLPTETLAIQNMLFLSREPPHEGIIGQEVPKLQ